MGTRDPRVDAYIAKAAPFAQPLLTHLRELVHRGCPEVEETIKWSMPSFVYAGGILCGMAAFKHHVSFGFWKHALVMGEGEPRDGMGSFGKMASMDDLLPDKTLLAYLGKAMKLNEDGVKAPKTRAKAKKSIPVPSELKGALAKNKKARATFDGFSPSHRYEYLEWITGAKAEDTRKRRLDQAVEWMAEGKPRNWKYIK